MKTYTCLCALLLGCSGALQAQTQASADDGQPGAYLSIEFGNGRMHGDNPAGTRWMGWRALEARVGREEPIWFGPGRIDFVHYNEGHPENNHRDGFALQWVAVRPLGSRIEGELGVGPYLSMNTTTVNGRQIDDARWGMLLSAALRIPLGALPEGSHLRIGLNRTVMDGTHHSTALLFGIGRQFDQARPEPDTEPAAGRWWFGGSLGRSITNLSGTHGANAGVLEARTYLDRRLEHWAVSGKLISEGDDGGRVDRDGVAGQLWYVQQVTPRFAMSAGLGPYLARNDRDEKDKTRTIMLVSLQAERALSKATRAFINFNRIKTFRNTNDRDLIQVGLLKRF